MAKLKKTTDKEFVNIVDGVGNDPIRCAWTEGDTVYSILERAGILVKPGYTVTLGRQRIKDIQHTTIQPEDTLVIAGKVKNG